MKIIEAYHCDYCKKYSKSKGVITRHEKECYHNPVTRACATCEHFGYQDYRTKHNGCDVTGTRPMCFLDIQISTLNIDESGDKTHKISLAHHCPLWKLRKEHEEE